VLLSDGAQGLFAPATGFSRERVQAAFQAAVASASDAPRSAGDVAALGRVHYAVHLAVILWWLRDRSPGQQATSGPLAAVERCPEREKTPGEQARRGSHRSLRDTPAREAPRAGW
jgi:hypothetical protein